MMISREDFVRGLVKYADSEIVPKLSTTGKWVVGALISMASNQADHMISELATNPIVKGMNIMDENGMVDAELLCRALKESAAKYGKLTVTYPLVGTMTFSADDVVIAEYYINGNK